MINIEIIKVENLMNEKVHYIIEMNGEYVKDSFTYDKGKADEWLKRLVDNGGDVEKRSVVETFTLGEAFKLPF